jgi:hypothetical protein
VAGGAARVDHSGVKSEPVHLFERGVIDEYVIVWSRFRTLGIAAEPPTGGWVIEGFSVAD